MDTSTPGGRVPDSPMPLRTTSSLVLKRLSPSFTLFPNLPPEVRDVVYSMTDCPQRIVEVPTDDSAGTFEIAPNTVPPLLHVNREAREFLLKKYKLHVPEYPTFFNPHYDVLYFKHSYLLQCLFMKINLRSTRPSQQQDERFMDIIGFCFDLQHMAFDSSRLNTASMLTPYMNLQTCTLYANICGCHYWLSDRIGQFDDTMKIWGEHWDDSVVYIRPSLHLLRMVLSCKIVNWDVAVMEIGYGGRRTRTPS